MPGTTELVVRILWLWQIRLRFGLYNSQNTTVIDTQINEALSAGINGFIASWWGPESLTDNSDKILINQASKFSDFSVTLYFETEIIQEMNSSRASEGAQIVNDVSYIMQNYASSDAFTQIGGRQVLFFYGVDNWPVQFWANVTNAIHANYPDLRLISDSFSLCLPFSLRRGVILRRSWIHDPVLTS